MKKAGKILLVIGLILLTAVVSSVVTMVLLSVGELRGTEEAGADPVKTKVEEIGSLLDNYFIDEYDPEKVEAAAADGAAAAMIEATGDRWSYYISADEMAAYNENLYNAYVGIGVTIQMAEEGVEIMSVTAGSPAEEAGIRIGDVITHVNGEATLDLGMEGTQGVVRGEAGTTVHFVILRGDTTLEMDVERREIVVPVAEAQLLEGNIGWITVLNFDHHCAEQTLACVNDMLDQGAEALIFDMRFNGGGLKTEMVEILDALLPEGILFQSVDYAGKEEIVKSDAAHLDIPMAVLVNEDSYSAAEFFAAALQEYEAAEVVGVQTVGKGNFQYTLPLSDGSAVALSTGKYFTPKGVSLTDVGVTPDLQVDLSYDDYLALYYGNLEPEEDEQLQAALELLQTKIS